MILWDLLVTFLLLGAFSFGGGLGSMELIRSRVVEQRMWLTNAEFTDIISISEMTPGPLGINIASFVGVRVAGVPGTVVATMAYVLPAFVIVIALSWFYYRYRSLKGIQGVLKGLRPAVAAMVMASAVKITANAWFGGQDNISFGNANAAAVLISLVMIVLLQNKKIGAVQAILLSGVTGALIYAVLGMAV